MNSLRISVLLFMCFLMLGCTSASVLKSSKMVTPMTYTILEGTKIERSVGKLRRLAVLPVQLSVTPKNPKMCLGPCGWEGLDNVIETGAIKCLRDRRGYEVILMDAPTAFFTPEEVSEFARTLAKSIRESDPDRLHEEVVSLVKEFGSRAKVDGVVVIQGMATSLSLVDWALGYASFTLSLPLSFLRIGVSLRADIFEVATGHTIWSSVLYGGMEPRASEQYGMVLLDPIEPAIPRVLTKPHLTDKVDGDSSKLRTKRDHTLTKAEHVEK